MNDADKFKVLVLLMGRTNMEAGWPYKGFPLEKQVESIKGELAQLDFLADVEFFGWKLIRNDSEIFESYKLMDEADGLMLIPLTADFASLGPDMFKLCEKTLPAVMYTKPFSSYYDGYAALRQNGARAIHVASASPEELEEPMTALKAAMKSRKLNLLVVRDLEHDYTKIDPRMLDSRWKGPAYAKRIKDYFGSKLSFATADELLEHYNAVDESAVSEVYTAALQMGEIKEPSQDEIKNAAKMYLAVKSLMKATGTNGFTIDCLSYIRESVLPISPCFTISKLLDEGIVAGCEADVETVLTIAMCLYLTGRPGFQCDPTVDKSSGTIIAAHCTAPTCVTGDAPQAFRFRTHNESLSNVGIDVKMPVKKDVTVLKVIGTGTIKYMGLPMKPIKDNFETYHLLTHESQAVEHKYAESDWGCRTKIAIKMSHKELEKFENNFFGYHRVVVYGKIQRKLRLLAQLTNLNYHDKMYLEF